MPYAHFYDALVLRTVDVGEADRFCILFTRERGVLAVRARGVRRPQSRMGGALLPLCRALVSVKELSSGFLVSAASLLPGGIPPLDPAAFFRAEGGVEVLLGLLHDEYPLPDLFDATAAFLIRSGDGDHIVLAFTFRVLHLFGVLPAPPEYPPTLSLQEHAFIQASQYFPLRAVPPLTELGKLRSFCNSILQEQLRRPLRAQPVMS